MYFCVDVLLFSEFVTVNLWAILNEYSYCSDLLCHQFKQTFIIFDTNKIRWLRSRLFSTNILISRPKKPKFHRNRGTDENKQRKKNELSSVKNNISEWKTCEQIPCIHWLKNAMLPIHWNRIKASRIWHRANTKCTLFNSLIFSSDAIERLIFQLNVDFSTLSSVLIDSIGRFKGIFTRRK